MKNKSARHKDANTFKFQPFSERIANIDVDIFHKVGHEYETQTEEQECFLYRAVEKWTILNLTEGYAAFCRELKVKNYITLPQLLLHKDGVVEILLKHLKLKDPLCLQPLLDIVVAIAKDLQKEFYQYYPQFLEILIELLHTKETDQIEWTFTCLAFLFKILWRSLIKDINSVFVNLLPLLSDSQPDYINAFAAESFAFVARKVRDRKAFLTLLLKVVKSKQDGVSGCGKLLFEVLNGVQGQFHSTATTMLPFLFESLFDEKLNQTVLFEILENVIANVVLNIHPQKSELLWTTFLSILDHSLQKLNTTKDTKLFNNVELILKLLGQAIEYKNGKLLQNPVPIVQQLVKLLNITELPHNILLTITQVSILILLSKSIKLPQEQASAVIRKILLLKDKSILLYFVDHVGEYSSFEPLILPTFLKYCASTNLEFDCFQILTKLILKKSPLRENGLKYLDWKKYSIDFASKQANNAIGQILLNHIKIGDDVLLNFDKYFCSLVCLPHVNLVENSAVISCLEENVTKFLQILKDAKDDDCVKKVLFLLQNTLECLFHLTEGVSNEKLVTIIDALLPFCKNLKFLTSLNALNLIITFKRNDDGIINIAMLHTINEHLEQNFNSPYHEMRLLTAHTYTHFETIKEFKLKHSSDPDVPVEDFKIFSWCYRVESIEPQVHTYRDQLLGLEKLNFDKPQMIMCNKTDFKTIPLRYLCGTLYINFQLLWEPVSKIIETHAHGLEINTFWSIFGEELKNVGGNITNPFENKIELIETNCEFLGDLYQTSQKLNSKPDFVNYRLLLWKAMVQFSDVAEAKTRDVSELLLNYINDEYMKSNSAMALTCSIKENGQDVVVDDDNDEELNAEEKIKKELTKPVPKSSKTNLKTLLHMLSVFSKVKSPKSMYRETDLYKLYFELLQHRNSEVQKGALDCLTTYKFKYLTPYKDNLYNLIDEKNFKNEITAFRLDKDTTTILQEHRENLIPLVMQIVFSKMNVKAGMRTGGKSSGQIRRTLVFRFLAGCQENEMLDFIKKSFRYFVNYLQDDPENMVETLINSVDLQSFIPPKRLQSTLNLINVVLQQFGGLMSNEVLTFLFNVLLSIGTFIKAAFDQSSNVHVGYLTSLRNIRTSSIKTLERFFEQFYKYPWTNKQINTVFTIFIWPYLDKLNIEGIHSPTSLLKLFSQWAANPRYFPLLVKHESGNKDQYILPHIMNLLVNEKSHGSVINTILEMIEKLLSLQPDEEEKELVIPIDDLLPVHQDILDRINLNDKLNYGSCILLPHVPKVLQKIQRKLESKNKNLSQRELFILSRISELVWEADVSDKILQLLLPVVHKHLNSGLPEEKAIQFLTTIKNLILNVESPEKHLKQISPMFCELSYPSCRKVLTAALDVISNKAQNDKLKTASHLITELNAWDAKWVDQPDFERRHAAFKKIQEYIETGDIDIQMGVLLIYNCGFLIKNEKDLSLKENSSHILKKMCPMLVKKYQTSTKDLDYLLSDTIFNFIRNGLKTKNDFRTESISLLGHLARECPDSHFILRDLNRYTNKTDLEVDFFENLTHLQLHRHARGLLKFCQITKELETTPNPRTLTQFILPLATHYLCSEKFVSKNSVIDAAIETIGTVSRILPWHQYEGLLKYYVTRLRSKVDYQKQLVRLTVVILDAFHFDLSKGHVKIEVVADTKPDIVEKNVEEEDVNEESVDEILDNEPEEDEEEAEVEVKGTKIYEKIAVLCKSTATRVIKTIQVVLLPQLHKSLAMLSQYENSHKLNRKKTCAEREEEDLLRVPISLAMVKLLQRLPQEILETNLPGVFMKLCTFLKSQLESVRRVTRETLQKIMTTLGPKYLCLLLAEITPLLSRGFHVHVLVFTVHGVLNCLKPMYEPTDVDKILLTVMELCMADLFGKLSEEKEVSKIVVKTSEAKATKSYDTLQIMAQYITEKCFMDLILPIKKVLESSHSFKTVNRAQDSLRYISLGLVDNNFVTLESLLKFAYGTASESIPEFLPKQKPTLTEKDKEILKRQKEDCFILPKMPTSRAAFRESNVKLSLKTNAHLLIEFGLRLCHVMLKRDKVRDEDYKPFIDPFVMIFKKCLKSKHIKLSTLTLQCLSWVLKYELPSMKHSIKAITKDLFAILHKYASAGLSKGDNFDLVVAAFKAMAVLVRDAKYHTIDVNQLKVLLLYAEQDMHDYDRQATAFNLLKAIISRKLIVPEIHDVMLKVAELSITSELNHVRAQARAVFHQFLMEYPLGNSLEKHLGFYISQLDYDMQYGRESAIEMIQMLINTFPLKVLKDHSGTLLITLGARLVNDEVPECRKMVGNCITSMISKLSKEDRQPLFEIVTLWLKENNISHRRLAAQLCGMFVLVEKEEFESRLPKIMHLLLKQFGLNNTPGKFVKLKKIKEAKDTEEHQRVRDHHLFQVFQLLLKISAHCPSFLQRKDDIENLAIHTQTLLGYPHDWVRLAAAQFLGFVLSATNIDHLATILASTDDVEEDVGYLCKDPVNSVKSLTLDLCDQLIPGSIKADLAEQVIKNLVFVARVLQKVPTKDGENNNKINLLWLTKRMRKIVNQEVVESASSTVLRTEVFKWIAGVGTALELENIMPVLHHLLAPLVREMITTEEKDAPLRQLSKEVANMIKKRVGMEEYTKTLSRLQQTLSVKRAERKRVRTQLAVTDPELFAKKKIKRHERKKESKKRKLEETKGKKRFKRKKTDLDIDEL